MSKTNFKLDLVKMNMKNQITELKCRQKELIEKNKKLMKEYIKYEKGFDILMDRFDYLPEEDKPIIDKQLKRCGL